MSLESCPTVKIKVEKTDDNPEGVVIINESDFVEGEHELYVEEVVSSKSTDTAATDSKSEAGEAKPWQK